jgi:uncharacterized membrane protein YbhN (UPF0104 family)
MTTRPNTAPTVDGGLATAPGSYGIDEAAQMTEPRSDGPPVRHWARASLVLLAVAVLATLALTRREALAESVALLAHLRWAWVVVVLGLEWASIAVFARMQRRLLEAGGVTYPAVAMLATVLGASALSTSLPLAGPELATAFTFRRFRQQGADPALAGWSLMVGGVISPVAAVVVLVGGAFLSGNDVLAVVGILVGILGATAAVALHTVTRSSRLRSTLEPAAARLLGRVRRVRRRPPGNPREDIRVWADRLASLRPGRWVWVRVSVLALANWLTDAGVLAASISAVGAPVPWRALLLVYGSGVVVRSLGITPGGLGLVEGTLCLGLVGAGLHPVQALASVLIYRFVNFWMVAAIGWVILLFVRRDRKVEVAIISSPAG